MNVKSIAKLLLAFSACFLGALLVGVAALEKGLLSPRALGIFLAALCLGSFVFLTIALQRLALRRVAQGLQPSTTDLSAVTPERRLLLIRMYKAWIVVLGLCLVGGIAKAASVHPIPLFPMLVGVTMNLLTTWVLVMAIKKLQKRLN